MLAWRSVNGDENPSRIRNNVGVGEKFVGGDEKASSDTSAKVSCFPRFAVVGDLGGNFDANDRVVNALRGCVCLLCQ